MPDWIGPEDDDETIGPWFNDTGDFGDQDFRVADWETEDD